MWACWVNRDSDRHPRTGHRVRSAHADQALPDNGGSKTAHLVRMLDSTAVRAHVSAAGTKGAAKSGAGRSRRGFSSKIHLKTDFDRLPIVFWKRSSPSYSPHSRDSLVGMVQLSGIA
jgi:hypothetical protein